MGLEIIRGLNTEGEVNDLVKTSREDQDDQSGHQIHFDVVENYPVYIWHNFTLFLYSRFQGCG